MTLRVGNFSGFYGDRFDALREMLDGGALDVLTGDYLAELTMLILGRDRLKDPSAGYARTFPRQLEECLGLAHERGVRTVRAVVLTHTGTTFCAGADLRDPPAPDAFVGLLRQVVELPKPVVARVDGHVRAGGLGLLGACDIAAASTTSTFAFTEVRIGVAPAVISLTLLPRADPRALARHYLTGERFDAPEATRLGLLTASGDDVDTVLAPVLDGLRRAAPEALTETKRLLTARVLETFDRDAADLTALSARLFSSPRAREGMTAFLERRDPAWVL